MVYIPLGCYGDLNDSLIGASHLLACELTRLVEKIMRKTNTMCLNHLGGNILVAGASCWCLPLCKLHEFVFHACPTFFFFKSWTWKQKNMHRGAASVDRILWRKACHLCEPHCIRTWVNCAGVCVCVCWQQRGITIFRRAFLLNIIKWRRRYSEDTTSQWGLVLDWTTTMNKRGKTFLFFVFKSNIAAYQNHFIIDGAHAWVLFVSLTQHQIDDHAGGKKSAPCVKPEYLNSI